jgi:hypothetical protein
VSGSPWIAARAFAQFRDALAANRAGYTPEWRAALGEGDPGEALLAILARQLEIQADSLNAMPLRMQLEYLEQLGASLLPAQSARAPLVFKLLDSATGDATVPAGSRVAAVLPPPAPSLDGDAAPAPAAKPEFFTEQEITAMRGKLAALYSIDPQDDVYADHSAYRATGFSLFTGMQPVPHRIYLGHGELFKLAGAAEIVLAFDFATPGANVAGVAAGQRPLLLDWEYLSIDGWLPLTLVEDRTQRFTRDGKITLAKFHGPDAKEAAVGGRTSFWIRATVSDRVPRARIDVEPAGYLVRYTPQPGVSVGDAVGIAGGASVAHVLALGEDRVVVDAPLAGAVQRAKLQTADGALLLGAVIGIATEPTRYLIQYTPTPVEVRVRVGDEVFIVGPANKARVLAVSWGLITVDAPLFGANVGDLLYTVSGFPLGMVTGMGAEPARYRVLYTPQPGVRVGDEVGTFKVGPAGPVVGGSKARILALSEGRIIVDAPLAEAVSGVRLKTGGDLPPLDAVGTVTSAPPYFRVPVENPRELLLGDEITVDGVRRATIEQTDESSLYLRTSLAGLQPGLSVELADALPPLRPDGADAEGTLPLVDVIRARVGFSRTDLPLDGAYLDGFSVDTSKDFYPFGEQPARFASFYIACKDAFSRRGARIDLAFAFVELGGAKGAPLIQAEYFNGNRWIAMGPNEQYRNDTQGFTHAAKDSAGRDAATVSFIAPGDWEMSSVNGDQNFWLRFRLSSGHYGQPLAISVVSAPAASADPSASADPVVPADPAKYVVNAVEATLKPPIVAELRVGYLVFSNPLPLDHCVTENDFAFTDHTEDARWPRSAFAPFVPVSDRAPALHLAFDAQPPAALVSLLVAVEQPSPDAAAQPFVWDYWGSRGWTELSVRDVTSGLTRTDLIQFVGPPDAVQRDGLGGKLYRIRARLKPGLASKDYRARLGGAWLNAVWAAEGTRYVNDPLGLSNGSPDQTFALPSVRANPAGLADSSTALAAGDVAQFNRALTLPMTGVPVLADEKVWVREWTGRGDDWETVVVNVPAADLRFETYPRDPAVKTAVWVRWYGQPHLYNSGSTDRHYVVERARGVFHFPGADGFIPPAGCPIVVTYVTGGGVRGNVAAGAIRELRSGVGFVESVANPLAASGGAAPELLREARERNAQSARNRDRAVSAEDYEWLARAASSEVARARALPLEGTAGRGARGVVGLVIVPQSTEAAPQPSLELRSRVLAYLGARAPAGLAGGIRIVAPTYARIGVRAEILPRVASEAGRVEARVRTRINQFLHPLSGGRDGAGWDFGTPVYLSDIAALIEDTPGVGAVRFLQLMVGSALFGDSVPVDPEQLVAAGDSQLKLIVPSVADATA